MGAPSPIIILFFISILAGILIVIGLGIVIIRATFLSIRDREVRRRRDAAMAMEYEIRPDRPGKPKPAWDHDLDG